MIICCSIRERFAPNAHIWACVRSFGKLNPAVYQHVPELSPSWNLFKKFRNIQATYGWNRENFLRLYGECFPKEMENPVSQKKLAEALALDRAGETVYLCCFCADPSTCHRSLLAEMLRNMGANVIVK